MINVRNITISTTNQVMLVAKLLISELGKLNELGNYNPNIQIRKFYCS